MLNLIFYLIFYLKMMICLSNINYGKDKRQITISSSICWVKKRLWFEEIQTNLKKLINDIKVEPDEQKQKDIEIEINKNEKELEALQKILTRVDTYRRNTFSFLTDKESIDTIITHIRIYKEQSE